jgi:hypothetical protein
MLDTSILASHGLEHETGQFYPKLHVSQSETMPFEVLMIGNVHPGVVLSHLT